MDTANSEELSTNSSPPSSSIPPQPPRELLEPTPRIPSTFILPPPSTSALLSRLQAFLPQIKDANERLTATGGGGEEEEEVVVLEEFSSDEEDSSEEEDESSDEDSSSEEDEEVEDIVVEEVEPMDRLLDIGGRPKVALRRKLVTDLAEEDAGGEMAGIDEMN